MRLSEASQRYLATRTQEGFSPHTIRAYRLQHQILIREVGDVGLAAVTLDLLRIHLTHHGHLQSSSLCHKIRAIKGLFRWAEDEGICVPSPARKLKEPKLGHRVPKALPMDELEWLRDACRTTREHAVVEFFFATGCRVGEAVRLNRRDVDWQRGSVVVVGTGNKEREVYLGSKARIWLTRYFAERQDADPALWVTERAPIGCPFMACKGSLSGWPGVAA